MSLQAPLRWAVRMPSGRASEAAASLRLEPGIQVLESAGEVWLRGPLSPLSTTQSPDPAPATALDRALRGLPCTGRFLLADDDVITPLGALVPVGRIPDGSWTPIARWFEPLVPTASLPGQPPAPSARVSLRLVLAEVELPATILLAPWKSFADWANSAPLARLNPLSFALSADRRALVRGLPLPPIPGARVHTENQSVVLPAGYRLEPDLDPAVLLPLLRGSSSDLILFNLDASYELIASENLVPVSRRAVRTTESLQLVQ